ncbi:hypothetical protein COSO111634_37405 [Corallococcus soli]
MNGSGALIGVGMAGAAFTSDTFTGCTASAVRGTATARLLARVTMETPAASREEHRDAGATTSRRTRSFNEPPSADSAGPPASMPCKRSASSAVSARA